MGHGACTRKIALFFVLSMYFRIILYFFPQLQTQYRWRNEALTVSKSFVGAHAASTGSTVQRIQLTKVAQYDNTISCAIHLRWENWQGIRKRYSTIRSGRKARPITISNAVDMRNSWNTDRVQRKYVWCMCEQGTVDCCYYTLQCE